MSATTTTTGTPGPAYLTKFPALQQLVSAVVQCLQQQKARVATVPGVFELEIRWGTWFAKGPERFRPGVPEAWVRRTLQRLESYTQWHTVHDWTFMIDYYYAIPHERWDQTGQPYIVRTTSQFVADQVRVRHMHKSKLQKFDFQFRPLHHMGLYTEGQDLRLVLNTEDPVPTEKIPLYTQTQQVRIKNRKSFWYQPTHAQKPLWSFDITQSWSGRTRSEAEQKQKTQAPQYEFELECLDTTAYMQPDTRRDEWFLALAMAQKVQDLTVGACVWDYKP